jgi:hypothetical protein
MNKPERQSATSMITFNLPPPSPTYGSMAVPKRSPERFPANTVRHSTCLPDRHQEPRNRSHNSTQTNAKASAAMFHHPGPSGPCRTNTRHMPEASQRTCASQQRHRKFSLQEQLPSSDNGSSIYAIKDPVARRSLGHESLLEGRDRPTALMQRSLPAFYLYLSPSGDGMSTMRTVRTARHCAHGENCRHCTRMCASTRCNASHRVGCKPLTERRGNPAPFLPQP